jgi:hypothetical protein
VVTQRIPNGDVEEFVKKVSSAEFITMMARSK